MFQSIIFTDRLLGPYVLGADEILTEISMQLVGKIQSRTFGRQQETIRQDIPILVFQFAHSAWKDSQVLQELEHRAVQGILDAARMIDIQNFLLDELQCFLLFLI